MTSRLAVAGAILLASASSAAAAVTVAPPVWDLGSAAPGVEIGPRSFVITPAPDAQADTVVAITSCPDFRVDLRGQALPAEVFRRCVPGDMVCADAEIQSFGFDVYFRPRFGGVESCIVTVDLADPATDVTFVVTGSSMVMPVDISIERPTTPTIDFGTVATGVASAARTVTIRNIGNDVLASLNVTAVGVTSAGFTVTSGLPGPIARGGTAAVTVTCTPPADGPITDTLTITSDDPDEPTISLPLACTGYTSALVFNPGPIELPPARIGETTSGFASAFNTTAMDLALEAASVTGDGLMLLGSPPVGTLIPTMMFLSLTVGHVPTIDADLDGVVTLTAGGLTATALIAASGRAPVLSVTPSGPVDLGLVCAGRARSVGFTAIDSGRAPFTIASIDLVGPDFMLMPATLSGTLQPLGETIATFDVAVTPTATALATQSATVTITTDIPFATTRVITLTVTGVPTATTAIDASIDAGATRVGDGAGPRTITLANCEATPLSITTHTVEGPDAADFVVTSTPPIDVAPGASASWQVELRPLSVGRKTATLRTTTSREGTIVEYTTALTGEGLDPSGHSDPGDDRGSYYACTTSHDPGGLALVVLAVALMLRSRRSRSAHC